jgi:hypothetical protein
MLRFDEKVFSLDTLEDFCNFDCRLTGRGDGPMVRSLGVLEEARSEMGAQEHFVSMPAWTFACDVGDAKDPCSASVEIRNTRARELIIEWGNINKSEVVVLTSQSCRGSGFRVRDRSYGHC